MEEDEHEFGMENDQEEHLWLRRTGFCVICEICG